MQQGSAHLEAFNPAIHTDRRSGKDRRKQMTSWRRMIFFGKRENVRRKADREKLVWVDKYSPKLFIAILIVVVLSMTDAVLTLYLIKKGAREVNPIMAYCLSHGPSAFILIKYTLTCISVITLLILSNVFIMRLKMYTRTIFTYVIGVFSCVVLWELFLIYRYVI